MVPSWLVLDTPTLLLLGIGLAVIGTISLLCRHLNVLLGFGLSTGVAALAVYSADFVFIGPPRSFAVIAVLAALNAVIVIARTRWAAAKVFTLVRVLSLPAVQATACLLVGTGLVVLATVGSEPVYENELTLGDLTEEGCRDFREIEGMQVTTDRGRPIPMLEPAGAKDVSDANVRRLTSERFQLIRTADRNPHVNCHGWVFTMGQFWLGGKWVDAILTDNDYRVVTDPRPGDVVVYRDGGGKVLHTALVRGAWDDLVLVESKWGALGTYIHLVDDTSYGDGYKFYRTSRPDHLLRGLSRPYPSSAVVRRG